VTATSTVHQARSTARRAANSSGVEWLARAGFVARGVVYGIIGLIALQVARDGGKGDDASKEGALREIAERSLGGVLLVLLAIGLAGYALWRAVDAIWGHRDENDEKKRTAKRLASGARAVFYGAFFATTVRFITDGPQAPAKGDQREQSAVTRVLEWPAGQWIVALAGVAVIGGALYIGYRGLSQKFDERLDTSEMGPVMGSAVDVLGTVGMAARSLVFGLAGYLLIRAAIDHEPDQASGLDGTLKTMAQAGYGQVLLVLTAVGLVAYGLYSWAEARYRQL
jgi:uncharacterized membrane protein YidH (DUF202 family)